jgi:hypothetical protein
MPKRNGQGREALACGWDSITAPYPWGRWCRGGTAAAWVAPVARRGRVAEVTAAGALQQVAADVGHVAQLLGGGQSERAGDHRVDARMSGYVAHAFQRADAQPVGAVDPAQRQLGILGSGQCHLAVTVKC